MKLAPALLVLAVLAAACSKTNVDLSGRWDLMMGRSNMQVQFGSDGRYTGTMTGMAGMGQVSGTYKLSGDKLEMGPPTVTGPNGSTSPEGGTMRVKLIPQGPNAYLLDAGTQKFQMTRIGPAQ